MSHKNIQREKIFKIDTFVLKHILDHSKSISTIKPFSKKIRFFGDFLPFFGQKSIFEFVGGGEDKFWNFFHPFQKVYIAVILRYYMHPYVYRAQQAH